MHQNRDRRAERFACEHARKNLATIFFLALRRNLALTRATAVQISLNLPFGDVDVRGTAINHHTDTAAMRFAKCGDAKELTECIAHWRERLDEIASNCRAFL